MNYKIVARFLSILAFTITASLIFPLFWALADGTEDASAFFLSALVGIAISAAFFISGKGAKKEDLGSREAIAGVAFSWVVASLIGCTPYIFSGYIPSFTDAYFEAMSGFTTTGATVMRDIEPVPRGILMWRAQTQWLGGMGIVVLVIAMLPLLGVNMTQLFKAESPGPSLEKTYPRIAEMAVMLWRLYMGLTVVSALLLTAGGMTLYNAIAHTFAAVSTGGFSTHNASVAYYDSAYVDYVLTFVMFIAGANFNLHLAALRGKSFRPYKDSEFHFYAAVVTGAALMICAVLLRDGVFKNFFQALRYSLFQVVSIMTTTGFVTADYGKWPMFTQLMLLALMLLGGCAGSTAGAIKCVRFQVVIKESIAELKKMIHPNAVVAIFQSNGTANPSMVASSACFIATFIIIWGLSSLAVSLCGNDIVTSISAVSATLCNVGPGLADVGPVCNFAEQSAFAKWIYTFDMLCGRLELYTVLVLFSRDMWRK
ncbi:TrkH family potassium uptake protein [Synergistes jonesii]|uniref:TrkH family potassium uptake protein n=1 Tax=Synergistes jonesii TaxID=2754 RepID=UPI00248EB672|nr:potassium transporter TrkG [Synergistes jonesii]